ncbi:GNAT family N-acetyltransferase [uncultured Alsobacter sp.]|uniref:GNAT family N-acetyltransferase n=1 Tax=uncultured Alsobacter sp. TaxID=1748258 RepID=UPI0025ECAF41|nr:GNAT family N-acetyltransferase [uncultured Alsobacter sp.]
MEHRAPEPFRGRGCGIDSHLEVEIRGLVRAQPAGVTLRATLHEGEILLDFIKVEPERRGHGLATRALRAVLALADRWGLNVRLQAISLADPGTGPDEDELLDWYGRHGFVDEGERSVSGLTIMVRRPCADCPCVKASGHLHQSHRHLAGLSGRTPPPEEGRSFALPKHR